MNKTTIAAVLTASALALATQAEAKSPKRGVGENSFSLAVEMDVLKPGVSWYYNWAATPSKGFESQVEQYEGIEFVPMCWNDNYDPDKIREYVKNHPDCKYILGFNEPNFTNQANMTPEKAAEKWPQLQALAKELNLKLVAPALNYSPNAPYQDPCKWMDEFVALVGNDAFDYTAIHVYGGFGVIKDLATKFHDKYGKDVWLTEFCYWPEAGNQNNSVAMSTQISFMVQAVEWLETTPWIARYAWFKAKGAYNSNKGPNYGLIIPQTGYDPRELSPQGKVYVHMSDFDKSVWNKTGEMINAVDYVASNSVELYPGNNPECGKPIEISRFNAGSTADWQFDIPAAGKYDFCIDVTGFGDPQRFDPSLKVQLVDGETVTDLYDAVNFKLPNSDTEYRTQVFTVELPAGHVTLRLADAAPYTPSGIRISRVGVYEEGKGAVNQISLDADSPVNVYNMQGMLVRAAVPYGQALESLPRGIYIINNKKILNR